MDDVELLAQAELFSGLGDDGVRRVAARARRVELDRNELVFAESDEPDALYLVGSGLIAIVKSSTDGRDSVVALMEPGDLFGELGLFDAHGGRTATARALERTALVAVPYAAVRDELDANPTSLWPVLALLTRRLRATDDALADSMFLDVTGRTAKRLLELAGDAEEFALPVTQEELAGMVGASRERVNKALAAFIRLGWLQQHERRYRITDREQLARRSR